MQPSRLKVFPVLFSSAQPLKAWQLCCFEDGDASYWRLGGSSQVKVLRGLPIKPICHLTQGNRELGTAFSAPFMLNSLVDLTNISKTVSPGMYYPGYTDIFVLFYLFNRGSSKRSLRPTASFCNQPSALD